MKLGVGDGEWTIRPDKVTRGGLVYSFGIGCDISFDLDMINRFGCEVHAFDPTPISLEWLSKQSLPAGFHSHQFGISSHDGVANFGLPVENGVSFTMALDTPIRQTCTGEVLRLATILERLGHDRIDVLKLDVEGVEYEIIDDLVEVFPRIGQLLIEFHHRLIPGREGVDRSRKAIKALLKVGYSLFYVSRRSYEYSFLGSEPAGAAWRIR